MPKRFGVPFFLVWFYSTQRRDGTPAFQSAPLRGKFGKFIDVLSFEAV
ncbi:MAG: hypothetical protein LBQ66_13115 [Planctomycetaceae bacterium]|nr:hypothetical protein [Planctomycetaceae bacterium]